MIGLFQHLEKKNKTYKKGVTSSFQRQKNSKNFPEGATGLFMDRFISRYTVIAPLPQKKNFSLFKITIKNHWKNWHLIMLPSKKFFRF